MSFTTTRTSNTCCVKKYIRQEDELIDDGTYHMTPHFIGRTILLYGRRDTSFPFQAHVGPDCHCMLITYSLIIIPTILFINNIAMQWGPGVIIASLLLLIATLVCYSLTACSDPGIVYVRPPSNNLMSEIESNKLAEDALKIESGESTRINANNNKIECGLCHIDRPRNAYHCLDCGVCIVELDHHCPWTGKCIGKKTLKTFYGFIWCLSGLVTFVVIMVIVTAAMNKPVFSFRPRD